MTRRLLKQVVLEELSHKGALWDYEIAKVAMEEFKKEGSYWFGIMRATLADLLSGGLIEQVDMGVDPTHSFGKKKLLRKYTLTNFGRLRMSQAGFGSEES